MKPINWALMIFLVSLAACRTTLSESESPRLIQTLAAFHRPESCAFSRDGKFLFVSNCGSGSYGPEKLFALARGQGAISKLAVGADGTVKMLQPKFVGGITAPLGITTLPVQTKTFRAGTLFVNVGFFKQTDERHRYITDAKKLGTGILAIDPDTGAILGKIDCGTGSAVAAAIGNPLLIPNGLAFDAQGNLYVAETGAVMDFAEPKVKSKPGVVRIGHAALDGLAQGASDKRIAFQEVAGNPNGVTYAAADDSIYIVTFGDDDPAGGAIYRIACRDFPVAKLPDPLAKGLTPLDGIALTPSGTIMVSRVSGDLYAVNKDGTAAKVKLAPDLKFEAPSDIKLLSRKDGSSILVVPEQDPNNPKFWQQRIRLIRLPASF